MVKCKEVLIRLPCVVTLCDISDQCKVVYDQKRYFGLGPIPKPKCKLADIDSCAKNMTQVNRNFLLENGLFF